MSGISASQAVAAQGSCPPFVTQDFHVGALSVSLGAIYGARADIEWRNPDLCGNDGGGVPVELNDGWAANYSMISADSIAHPGFNQYRAYAQAGYLQAASTNQGYHFGTAIFTQYRTQCGLNPARAGCTAASEKFHTAYPNLPNPSGVQRYSERKENTGGDGHINFYIDGVQKGETSYDPTGDWASLWRCEFEGETFHEGDDMPGTQPDPATSEDLAYYDSLGTAQYLSLAQFSKDDAAGDRYHATLRDPAGPGKASVDIWTDPLFDL